MTIGYTRARWGRGFTYRNPAGDTVTDVETRAWLQGLAIPPAWEEVEIAADPDSDVLATGRDAAGRKQFLYHPDFRARQEKAKFERIVGFAERLEKMRRVTGQHLRRQAGDRKLALACMVRLLDLAYFRPGNSHYEKENHSYGLTTMRSRHLTIEDDELIFAYRGKGGREQERHVVDARLARVVAELDAIPGYRIFKYYDQDGDKVTVESQDLNAYIKEVMGEQYSAKDFRTWAGTLLAAVALDELGLPEDDSQAQARIRQAVDRVAQRLGNTPAVARSSYIDPRVIMSYLDGRTAGYFVEQIENELERPEELSLEELGVLALLKAAL